MFTFKANHAVAQPHGRCEPIVMGNASNDSNFIIVDQQDIRRKLDELLHNNVLLSITIPGKFVDSTLLTTITFIEQGHIFLGGFQNERFNQDLLRQDSLRVTANFEGIAVNFILEEVIGHEKDALFNIKARLPKSLEWMQRRNARRVRVPMTMPVKMQYHDHGNDFRIADISVDGFSYTTEVEDQHRITVGEIHDECSIIMPDDSVYQISFQIANSTLVPFQRTKQINRIGCEFKRASYRLDAALQRLINQIDFVHIGRTASHK